MDIWPELFRWIDERIEAALVRRGISSSGVPGSVIRGPIPAPSLPGHNHTADGDGGKLSGAVTDTYQQFEEQAGNPATPGSNLGRLYAKDVGGITHLFWIDQAATVTDLVATGNPMTTLGDIITGDTGGTPKRLPIGSSGEVLTVVSGEPDWSSLPVAAVTKIAEVTVGAGGTATVSFTSIPGTYKHLEIHYIAQSEASGAQALSMRFNGDTGNNYHWQYVLGNTTAASAATATGQSSMRVGSTAGSGAPSGAFSNGSIIIPDYTNTVTQKAFHSHGGRRDTTSAMTSEHDTGWWDTANAAITQIDLFVASGDIAENSRFTLYGYS